MFNEESGFISFELMFYFPKIFKYDLKCEHNKW